MSLKCWSGYNGNVYFEPIKVVGLNAVNFSERSRTNVNARSERSRLGDELAYGAYHHQQVNSYSQTPSEPVSRINTQRSGNSARLNMSQIVARSAASITPRSSPVLDHKNLESLLTVSAAQRERPSTKSKSASGQQRRSESCEYIDVIHSGTTNFPIRRGHLLLSRAERVRVPINHTIGVDNADLHSFKLRGQKFTKQKTFM